MLNAYISAAFVEELCKYFGFWMVVHPDFCTLMRHQRGRSNETALELSTEETPLMATATSNTLNTGNNLEELLLVVATTAISSTATSSQTVYDRSYKSLGCAITIAMITVSLGFACCENLLYVPTFYLRDEIVYFPFMLHSTYLNSFPLLSHQVLLILVSLHPLQLRGSCPEIKINSLRCHAHTFFLALWC